MDDLVKRLREWWEYDTGHLVSESIACIERLDRELAETMHWRDRYHSQLEESIKAMNDWSDMATESIARIEHQSEKITALNYDVELRDVRIERLERELAESRGDATAWRKACEIAANDLTVAKSELAAEKAMADHGADRVSRWVGFDDGDGGDAAFLAAYRKARGL